MEMTWLGDLDPALLQNYFGKLRTTEVVVTEERIAHIRERHPEDFALFVQYGAETVLSPDLLILDEKHVGTIFAVRRLTETNLNVVVRLALEIYKNDYKNSVMTFYRLRDKNLKKLLEKNRLLYSRE